MKQFLLATVLIALPVAAFTAVEVWVLPGSPPAAARTGVKDPLGDLSAYKAIVADTAAIADKGDFTAAQKRITDFETMWDDAESAMRPKDTAAWGNVDQAADDALSALRKRTPNAATVKETLAALSAALTDPAGDGGGAATGAAQSVSGIAVTDASGHAIPCETLLRDLSAALASVAADKKAAASDLQAKATERCNADDDTRADAFTAQALALVAH